MNDVSERTLVGPGPLDMSGPRTQDHPSIAVPSISFSLSLPSKGRRRRLQPPDFRLSLLRFLLSWEDVELGLEWQQRIQFHPPTSPDSTYAVCTYDYEGPITGTYGSAISVVQYM